MKNQLAVYGGAPVLGPGEVKSWPPVDADDDRCVMEALHLECQSRGKYTGLLEDGFRQFNGNAYSYFTSSGTAALQMCVAGCGIGAGDQVIVTAWSWPSSASCILHNMAVPVFVDIDPETFLIDPAKIEAAITPRTKGILVVHLHGLCCDMDPILTIARKHKLAVIEDACQAHHAQYKGKRAGTFGDCAAFSFNQNKCLSSGEGGMFVTDRRDVFERGMRLVDFGDTRSPDPSPEFHAYGMAHKYCNNEITAAFAWAQLRKFPGYFRTLCENTGLLHASLQKLALKGLKLPRVPENCVHNWYNYNLRIDFAALGMAGISRDGKSRFRHAVCRALQAEGVNATVWQGCILPELAVFKAKNAYGKGYPWAVPGADEGVNYDPALFPNALDYCCSHISIVMTMRAPNTIAIAAKVAEAVEKVFSCLAEIDPDRILNDKGAVR